MSKARIIVVEDEASVGNRLSKFNLKQLLGQYTGEFFAEVGFVNYVRMRIVSLVAMVIYFILWIYDVMLYFSGKWEISIGYQIIFYTHTVLILFLGAIQFFFWLKPLKTPEETSRLHELLVSMTLIVVMLCTVFLALGDVLNFGSIVVYLGMIFGSASIFVLPNLFGIVLYTSNMVLMLIVLGAVHRIVGQPMNAQIINTVSFTLVAFIMSRVLFYSSQKDFRNRKVIEKQKIELEIEVKERKLAEDQIKALLQEKELLLKEVHHRIRNNMSTIKGLFTLQSGSLENNPEAVNALREAENRVQSMLSLYDRLFLTSDYINVSTKEYFENLVDEIVQNFPNSDIVRAKYDIEDVALGAKTIFALGIVINELITNTMKHAFVGKEEGKIDVTLLVDEGHAVFTIRDDGVEIPGSISFENPAAGFGFKLVSMLVKQLEGSINIERENGTRFTIKFNLESDYTS